MRIGFGFDTHRFGEAKSNHKIKLGGVDVPHTHEILAHSDGDVILHALCDAILGALALGDIGVHFPDSDAKWKGADSRVLLRSCYEKATTAGLELANADITLIGERPKLRPHIAEIRLAIASEMGVEVEKISVKATTTEEMGSVGRGEGLAAQAAILLS